ncbi:MGH1-like glycoside hydrolase domain-containing protein [Paenibacillus sp. Leaf72]|uniref:MGH1-like glycoside hydrolase domain-containing protein n=1 Tax=Paenibacillus sp. Leaf72 TaxID=1736234 RepID=UPI0006FCF9FA|nr:hypothetical protein [Paenibacillus sp. Leaf72]KQO13833.1 hypothetical protein ASF12_30180 [Paenibacillus sp. Leaf72]
MEEKLLERLRSKSAKHIWGQGSKASDQSLISEWEAGGVKFAAAEGRLEGVHEEAMRRLLDCIVPTGGNPEPILHEGGVYLGCWLESTGTINAELLSRFIPSVSETTYLSFAAFQREDGLFPYKITENGPSYRQIQLVTPLARSVWNHYALHGRDKAFLQTMYDAMSRYDDWLAAHRDTRGTGCVEAFSTFDTGHDLSPRFWHVPDTPHLGDAAHCQPDSPILPFLAPDLTANVYCQRQYLALIAEELGLPSEQWKRKAEASLASLFEYCFDEADHFFYDRDRQNELVKVQSDVLLRVMACEVGDRRFFDTMLRRYLLNTSKFFAKFPFTSMAMDDPRFDPFSSYNSWGGPTNFLSIIRAAHAFEKHQRYVELTWVMYPLVSAMANMTRFSQALSPWTGVEGYTETYSPAILSVLDYVERLCGILPAPDGTLWFTGLLPYAMDHGDEPAGGSTAYSRTVDGSTFELLNTREESVIYLDGKEHMRFPFGIRAVTDRAGRLSRLIGMSVRTINGVVHYDGAELALEIKGNEQLHYTEGHLEKELDIGIVYPAYS